MCYSFIKSVICVLLLQILTDVTAYKLNERPIVGILAQEISDELLPNFPAYSNFIAASYVKAVESSGARVVPIVVNKTESYYRNVLNSVNGLVLPGGGAKNGIGYPYYNTVETVYKIAVELNENGRHFPILGVCLGYEFLITVANNDKNILKNCSVFHESLPIRFTDSYIKSTLFFRLNSDQAHTLQYRNSTYNWHIWCALSKDFKKSSLNSNWKITSTSTSSGNVEFISSVEHVKYPFFGIQFHPEKIAFEWVPVEIIPRGEDILIANRYLYDQLVYHAKQNNNAFISEKYETNSLIYNYPCRYTGHFATYTEMYVF